MSYQLILADPPWTYGYSKQSKNDKAGRGCANTQYSLLDNKTISEMPVKDLADPDGCILFLWASGALLKDCLAVMEGWGFEYVTMAVWTKHCRGDVNKDRLGVGYWFRSNAEPILVGRSGKKPATRRTNASNHITDDTGEDLQLDIVGHLRSEQLGHSKKPDMLHRIIEQTWPDLKKAELFAREHRAGWDCWGNQCDPCATELTDFFGGNEWTPN